MEMTECGAASLGMILSYYGCYVPLEKLRVDTGVSRDGCNAYNIILGGEKYGLKGKGRFRPDGLFRGIGRNGESILSKPGGAQKRAGACV